jgi:SAM-dependent methyltransferase
MTQVFDAYAAYYDVLYRDKDYSGEALFVRKLLLQQSVESGEILELGCGTGKHANHLAQMGYRIQGVDISSAMVSTALLRLPTELIGLVSFLEGDVRAIRLGRKFDAVISLFHVASYQTSNDDISAMFLTASQHLNTGGIFIFDFWYGPAVLTDRPTVRVKRWACDAINVTRIAEPVMRANENQVDVNYTVVVSSNGSKKTETINETHCMRYFFAPELRFLLAATGFELISLVEWISGRETSFDTWSATVVAIRL